MWELNYDTYQNDPFYVNWGNRALDIVGARYGEGRYYSPDDPRFQQNDPAYSGAPWNGYPGSPSQLPAGYVPGTVNTQGFQINWWTAALIGLLVGAFLLGKRR